MGNRRKILRGLTVFLADSGSFYFCDYQGYHYNIIVFSNYVDLLAYNFGVQINTTDCLKSLDQVEYHSLNQQMSGHLNDVGLLFPS